jgi:putative solute:sodium symporter small subunit
VDLTTMPLSDSHRRYWSKNLRITAILMAIWFAVTFVVGYFARDLNFSFFGWPFSVWMGGQGALIVYCAIVWFYARRMNKLDIEHKVQEED